MSKGICGACFMQISIIYTLGWFLDNWPIGSPPKKFKIIFECIYCNCNLMVLFTSSSRFSVSKWKKTGCSLPDLPFPESFNVKTLLLAEQDFFILVLTIRKKNLKSTQDGLGYKIVHHFKPYGSIFSPSWANLENLSWGQVCKENLVPKGGGGGHWFGNYF